MIFKKKLILAMTIFCILSKTAGANSQENYLAYSFLKFSGGVIAGALIHEGAHAFVAGLTDTRMSWKIGTYNQPIGFTEEVKNKDKGVAVYSAGLLSQIIGAEVILQADKIDKNDSFIRGLMAWNVLNAVFYSLDYWVFKITNKGNGYNYQGDLKGIEHYSNEALAQGFAISIAALATYQ
ncbi:MAG: hypothetical protein ACPL5I_15280 [Thermodesulfobacteriota bacterium]